MENKLKQIFKNVNIKIKYNKSLKNYTSFKIGGVAAALIFVKNTTELKFVIKKLNKQNLPYKVIANGTNLLIKEEYINKCFIKLEGEFNKIKVMGNVVKVGVNVSLFELNKQVSNNNLTGLEWSYGIPGTVGGAVFMNAGAYGKEFKSVVKKVTYFDGKKVLTKNVNNLKFKYRKSLFTFNPKFVIMGAEIVLKKTNSQQGIKNLQKMFLQKRLDSQPYKTLNAGSTFKRSGKIIVSKVIDELGLKGKSIGGAEVSKKHAGFIINKGNASCKDVLNLIEYVKAKVKDKTGIEIETEVEIIGEDT